MIKTLFSESRWGNWIKCKKIFLNLLFAAKKYFCYVWSIFSNEKDDLKEESTDEVVAAANSNKRTTSEVCLSFYFSQMAYSSPFFQNKTTWDSYIECCSSTTSHNRPLIARENIIYSQTPSMRTQGVRSKPVEFSENVRCCFPQGQIKHGFMWIYQRSWGGVFLHANQWASFEFIKFILGSDAWVYKTKEILLSFRD